MLSQISPWILSLQQRRADGQAVVEYSLILVLVAIVSIAILTTLGTSVTSVFSQANAAL